MNLGVQSMPQHWTNPTPLLMQAVMRREILFTGKRTRDIRIKETGCAMRMEIGQQHENQLFHYQ
jgi:hypothetical protein